ncbi:glycosyltransferase [Chloroflexota bacterium]
MKQLLLKIRFVLIPQDSYRELLYHAFRVALMDFRTGSFRNFQEQIQWRANIYQIRKTLPEKPQSDSFLYATWMKNHEPGRFELSRQRKICQEFSKQPLISIITPVYNPAPDVLRDTIQSVMAQTYPIWELCLADGKSDIPGVRQVLKDYAERDARINVEYLSENLGISGNSNAALKIAQGEFVALLDHDDLLAPDMLYNIVSKLESNPDVDVIYFDEDKISAKKKTRNSPWFKPSVWSPDLLLSTNYLMHAVIRRSLINDVGSFNPSMDGAQDWDLALRITEKTQKLVHIPRVLYHWRQVPGSAASDAFAKPWALEVQQRCIQAHLDRLGSARARVDYPDTGHIRVHWPVSGDKVSIIIPTKDKVDILKTCLNSIFEQTTYPNYEILLIDNQSTEEETQKYYESLSTHPNLKIIHYDKQFNYQKMNNMGVQHASGNVFIFLNNDTEIIEPDWLEELVGWAERLKVGVVGTKLLRPDGKIQHAGIIIGLGGHGSHVFEGGEEGTYGPFGSSEWYRDYQAVTGACMAVRREVFESLGGFDEAYQVGYGDIDLCLRAYDAGFRIFYTPYARVIHHEGATRRLSQPPSDVLRASVRMYEHIKAGDPFFNPNLSNRYRLPKIAAPNDWSRESILHKILGDYDLIDAQNPATGEPERWHIEQALHYPEATQSPQKRRILLVTHELSRSGAPIILFEVARLFKEKGYTVNVLSPADGPLREDYHKLGIEVTQVPLLFEDSRAILNYFDGNSLLIANTILSYRTIFSARAFEVPSLWWIHESSFGQDFARTNPMICQALNAADKVIFPSSATADLYRDFGHGTNYHPIHIGKDVEGFDDGKFDQMFEASENKLCLVQVASIESRKGQDILLKAFESLPPEIAENIECNFIGRILSETERSYCQKVIRKARRNKNIRVLGELSAEEVKCYLQKTDMFVLPSRDEALPVSLIEAMAFGKAIIATRVGGIPEIINHGNNGLLVENEDSAGIADQILELYLDPVLRQQLGKNARASYVQSLTLDSFFEQFLGLVESVTT